LPLLFSGDLLLFLFTPSAQSPSLLLARSLASFASERNLSFPSLFFLWAVPPWLYTYMLCSRFFAGAACTFFWKNVICLFHFLIKSSYLRFFKKTPPFCGEDLGRRS
jgi:hypothetical protein